MKGRKFSSPLAFGGYDCIDSYFVEHTGVILKPGPLGQDIYSSIETLALRARVQFSGFAN
jgi:hypothetical protein